MPIRSLRCMFVDKKSILDSSMTHNGKMYEWHVPLSFHRVRESIASGIVNYQSIDGKSNPVDVLMKH